MGQSFSPTTSVYLGGSSNHLDEDIKFFRKIAEITYRHGHILTSNWVEKKFHNQEKYDSNKKVPTKQDWEAIFNNKLAEMLSADMVIMECTWYGFSEGMLVMAALKYKKPVLCVMRQDPSKRLISGIGDQTFVVKQYKDEVDLEKIVKKFIQDNTLTSKDLRFNFFIDNEIYNHLRWASFKTGKTKAEIIRNLIEKEIENKEL